MKVMYFIHTLDVGGAETICAQYLLELQKRQIDVVLVVIAHRDNFIEKRLQQRGIKIISIYPFKRENIVCIVMNSIYRRIISLESWWNKLIDEEKPDVIHINTFFDFFSPTKFPYNKMVYTFHGEVERYMGMMQEGGKRNIKRYTEGGMKFFALSSEMATRIKEMLDTENIVYMPNGVDICNIRSQRYGREEILVDLGIELDAFIVGHIARFHEVKNQERTVKIFQEVLNLKANAYLLFIGNCDNGYGRKIKAKIDEMGMKDKVRFLGVRDDATKIMSILDAMVLPSITESFSLVMVEAQAHNIRSIGSMTLPESVICNDNCFRLSLKDSNEKWAYYITGDFTENHRYNLEDFSMNSIVDKMLVEYRKSAGL